MLLKQFSLTIANASASNYDVVLIPAYFDTLAVTTTFADPTYTSTPKYTNTAEIVAAGFTNVDAVVDDGTIATSLTATAGNSRFTIRAFLNFIRLNPMLVRKLTVAANNTDVYERVITVTRCNPGGNQGDEFINLSDFFAVNQYNEDKIVINDLDMEISDETLVVMPVYASRTVTITFHF
jgi:hypothetical protein